MYLLESFCYRFIGLSHKPLCLNTCSPVDGSVFGSGSQEEVSLGIIAQLLSVSSSMKIEGISAALFHCLGICPAVSALMEWSPSNFQPRQILSTLNSFDQVFALMMTRVINAESGFERIQWAQYNCSL